MHDEQFSAIADGLAGPGYAVINHFLREGEVNDIVTSEYFLGLSTRMRQAGIGKDGKASLSVRGDRICWIERSKAPTAVQLYFNRIFELIQFLNRELFLSLKDMEAHVTCYPVGAFYKRHVDQFRHDDHRKLSAILYLNSGWRPEHGGSLRLYTGAHPVDILPEAGRLVIFRSDQLEHEVLPATRDRFSITGWILDREIM